MRARMRRVISRRATSARAATRAQVEIAPPQKLLLRPERADEAHQVDCR